MNTSESMSARPLRLWPGIAIAVLMVLVRAIASLFAGGALVMGAAPLAGGALILLWWLFFSRVRWTERLGVLALLTAAGTATYFFIHPSVRGGLMGRMFPMFFAVPGLALALVVWAATTRRLGSRARFAALIAVAALTCGLFAAVRTDGLLDGHAQLAWRWTPTAEDRLLAQAPPEPPAAAPTAPAAASGTATAP